MFGVFPCHVVSCDCGQYDIRIVVLRFFRNHLFALFEGYFVLIDCECAFDCQIVVGHCCGNAFRNPRTRVTGAGRNGQHRTKVYVFVKEHCFAFFDCQMMFVSSQNYFQFNSLWRHYFRNQICVFPINVVACDFGQRNFRAVQEFFFCYNLFVFAFTLNESNFVHCVFVKAYDCQIVVGHGRHRFRRRNPNKFVACTLRNFDSTSVSNRLSHQNVVVFFYHQHVLVSNQNNFNVNVMRRNFCRTSFRIFPNHFVTCDCGQYDIRVVVLRLFRNHLFALFVGHFVLIDCE